MPEANTVRLTADRLSQALVGRPLVRAELRWPTLGAADLVGATPVSSTSLGKHLLLRLDTGYTLHSHLRMDGYWRIAANDAQAALGRNPQIRAVLGNARWTALGWHLGMMDLVATPDEQVLVGHLGPDLLAPGFRAATAPDGGVREAVRRAYLHPDRPICAVLLDQQVAAGIGTIFLAESLFELGIWPWTPVIELTRERTARVFATASDQLIRAVAVGQKYGMRAVTRKVHGQHLRYCVRCNTQIAVGSLAGADVPPDQGTGNRIVFYCPRCQAPETGGSGAVSLSAS